MTQLLSRLEKLIEENCTCKRSQLGGARDMLMSLLKQRSAFGMKPVK